MLAEFVAVIIFGQERDQNYDGGSISCAVCSYQVASAVRLPCHCLMKYGEEETGKNVLRGVSRKEQKRRNSSMEKVHEEYFQGICDFLVMELYFMKVLLIFFKMLKLNFRMRNLFEKSVCQFTHTFIVQVLSSSLIHASQGIQVNSVC